MIESNWKNLAENSAARGPITHDEAWDHLSRFTHKAFGRGGSTPILTIPADTSRDSDIRLGAYIYQQRERDAQLAEANKQIKALKDAVYHTKPGEMEFGGEGWTWKQQADFLYEQLKSLRKAIDGTKEAK